jgi:hypothetical protein
MGGGANSLEQFFKWNNFSTDISLAILGMTVIA